MPRDPVPSAMLVELANTAIDHAANSLEEAEQLVPFVMEQRGEALSLTRCCVENLDGTWDVVRSVDEAKKHGAQAVNEVDAVAIAFDGYVTTEDGKKFDCVYVEMRERRGSHVFTFGQRYKRASGTKEIVFLGDPFLASCVKCG